MLPFSGWTREVETARIALSVVRLVQEHTIPPDDAYWWTRIVCQALRLNLMKAREVVKRAGEYRVTATATDPDALRLYRNRGRLKCTIRPPGTLHWEGHLMDGDLIEADSDLDSTLTLSLTEVPA